MSYYRNQVGDFKTYGYARGDPGLLSGIFKLGAKIIRGGARFFRGPLGTAVATTAGVVAATRPAAVPAPVQPPGTVGGAISFPGGTAISVAGVPAISTPMAPGMCPSGYHYAKDGSGRLVRNRRMNVANPKALRRSLRRVQGFEKLVRRTFTISGAVKPKKGR